MKIRRFALLGLILVLAVLCLPACGGSDGGDAAADEGAIEVVDSYLDVDEETGNYTVAVIVQNNSDTTISESMLESTAYDKDGNVIKPAEDSEGTMAFYPSFGVLQPGEKGAWIETNEYSDGATIWGIYTGIPDRLEWKVSDIVKGDGKEPPFPFPETRALAGIRRWRSRPCVCATRCSRRCPSAWLWPATAQGRRKRRRIRRPWGLASGGSS